MRQQTKYPALAGRVAVYLTPKERECLRALAATAGVSMSTYLKQLIKNEANNPDPRSR